MKKNKYYLYFHGKQPTISKSSYGYTKEIAVSIAIENTLERISYYDSERKRFESYLKELVHLNIKGLK